LVRRALAMASGEQYFRLAINFASIAVISRLLTPAEVGIAVIGVGIMAIAVSVREFATSDFLIQRREVVQDDIRTSFTVLFLLTGLVAAGIIILAPWFGAFYGEEKLARFLRISAAATLIDAVSLPIRALLRREMAFGTIALINMTGAILTAVTTILLALAGFSSMSIAWGAVAAAAGTAVLSFYIRPDLSSYRPTLKSWRSLLAFGGYNGASYVVGQANETIPQLVLGSILPPAAVGLYNRAITVARIPRMVFLTSVLNVAFPAFAEEVRNERGLKEPYLRALGALTVFYWPAVAMIALLAHPIVSLLLGEQWLIVVPVLQVIAVAYLAWFPDYLTTPLLLAVGANRDRALVLLLTCPLAAVVLCSAAYFGIMAMAMAQLVTVPYMMFVALYFVRRHVAFRWREVGAALWRSAIVLATSAAGPIGVVVFTDKGFALPISAAVVAVLLASAGWLAGVLVTRHPILLELRNAAGALAATAVARAPRRLRGRIAALGRRALPQRAG
jgi:O-antigen/teichoic acid export membrane protein